MQKYVLIPYILYKTAYKGTKKVLFVQKNDEFCIFFEKNLHIWNKSSTFAPAFEKQWSKIYAMIAQLVEHDLAKVGVASSSLVHRSYGRMQGWPCIFLPRWRNW